MTVIAMTGHEDFKLADHYSKIDGEVQRTTSEKIVEHLESLGLVGAAADKFSNEATPLRLVKA